MSALRLVAGGAAVVLWGYLAWALISGRIPVRGGRVFDRLRGGPIRFWGMIALLAFMASIVTLVAVYGFD